jgi:acyl-CoA reductase-like NAD-dependent aldehyde dehydrogenase
VALKPAPETPVVGGLVMAEILAKAGLPAGVVQVLPGAEAGPAVPLRVAGSLIDAVGVSGLAEEDDHRFVIDALRAFARTIQR